jgi:serine/threonine protein kinase
VGSPAAEPSLVAEPLVADRPDPAPALALFPHIGGCRITAELAAGGMAVLYRGVQESLNRPVAIKALRSDVIAEHGAPVPSPAPGQPLSSRPDWLHRFIREARILALLQHENLVHVYDLVDLREPTASGALVGSLFIVMELCEGIDLLDLLDALAPRSILPVEVAALVALGAARALAHVHAHGILHRDVKPANLFLTRGGLVKLVDFGTAWDPANPSDRLGTEVGLGTPSYMSPEQALGDPLDHRSDQFALGVVLYQMLGGRKPFAPPPGDANQRTGRPLPSVTARSNPPPLHELNDAVPAELLDIVGRCLERQVGRRYGSTDELVLALEHWIGRSVGGSQRARLADFLVEQKLVDPEAAALALRPFGGAVVGGAAAGLPALQAAGKRPSLGWLRRLWPRRQRLG